MNKFIGPMQNSQRSTHIHTPPHTYTRPHTHTHAPTHIHTPPHTDTRPHTHTHAPTHIGMRTSYFCASTYVHRCTSNRVEDESGGVPDHKARRLENVDHGRIVKDTHCRSHRTKATIIGIGEGWVREEYNKTKISSCSGNSIWSQNPKCKKTLPWRGEDAIQVHLRRLQAIKRATFNKKGALYMESHVSNICFKPRKMHVYYNNLYQVDVHM